MSVTLDSIADIARQIAAEQTPPLDIVAVTSGDGGSDRVEILISIAGCENDPCRILINFDRHDRAGFEEALRKKFRELPALNTPR